LQKKRREKGKTAAYTTQKKPRGGEDVSAGVAKMTGTFNEKEERKSGISMPTIKKRERDAKGPA